MDLKQKIFTVNATIKDQLFQSLNQNLEKCLEHLLTFLGKLTEDIKMEIRTLLFSLSEMTSILLN